MVATDGDNEGEGDNLMQHQRIFKDHLAATHPDQSWTPTIADLCFFESNSVQILIN